jgi:hypothetical protein
MLYFKNELTVKEAVGDPLLAGGQISIVTLTVPSAWCRLEETDWWCDQCLALEGQDQVPLLILTGQYPNTSWLNRPNNTA